MTQRFTHVECRSSCRLQTDLHSPWTFRHHHLWSSKDMDWSEMAKRAMRQTAVGSPYSKWNWMGVSYGSLAGEQHGGVTMSYPWQNPATVDIADMNVFHDFQCYIDISFSHPNHRIVSSKNQASCHEIYKHNKILYNINIYYFLSQCTSVIFSCWCFFSPLSAVLLKKKQETAHLAVRTGGARSSTWVWNCWIRFVRPWGWSPNPSWLRWFPHRR